MNEFIMNGKLIKLENGKVLFGKAGIFSRKIDVAPRSTKNCVIVPQLPDDNKFDAQIDQEELLTAKGYDLKGLEKIIDQFNDLQDKVGYNKEKFKDIPCKICCCMTIGIMTFLGVTCFPCYMMAQYNGVIKLRDKYRDECRQVVRENNGKWQKQYGYSINIPEEFPCYFEVNLVDPPQVIAYEVPVYYPQGGPQYQQQGPPPGYQGGPPPQGYYQGGPPPGYQGGPPPQYYQGGPPPGYQQYPQQYQGGPPPGYNPYQQQQGMMQPNMPNQSQSGGQQITVTLNQGSNNSETQKN